MSSLSAVYLRSTQGLHTLSILIGVLALSFSCSSHLGHTRSLIFGILNGRSSFRLSVLSAAPFYRGNFEKISDKVLNWRLSIPPWKGIWDRPTENNSVNH